MSQLDTELPVVAAPKGVVLDFQTPGKGQLELALGRICERNKEQRADAQVDRDRIQRFREHQRKQLEIEAGEAVR